MTTAVRPARIAVSAARPHRRRARPSVTRICWWQATVALGLLTTGRAWWLTAVAAAALTTSAVPVGEAWLSTVAVRWLRLRLRGGTSLLPATNAHTVDVGGEQVALVSRPDALVAVLRPGRAGLGALLAAALRHRDDPAGPRCEVRVVACRRPLPRAWLVLRALRDVDSADDAELRPVLAAALRRLRRGGLELTPLSARDIAAAAQCGPVRERWHAVRVGDTEHVAFRLAVPGPATLQRLMLAAGDTGLTVAVRARGDGGLTGVLRVATEAGARRLPLLAPGADVHLERLDGRHGPAVAATLPIGGSLS